MNYLTLDLTIIGISWVVSMACIIAVTVSFFRETGVLDLYLFPMFAGTIGMAILVWANIPKDQSNRSVVVKKRLGAIITIAPLVVLKFVEVPFYFRYRKTLFSPADKMRLIIRVIAYIVMIVPGCAAIDGCTDAKDDGESAV